MSDPADWLFMASGIVGVARVEGGLVIEFSGHPDPADRLRVGLLLADAVRGADELRKILALLEGGIAPTSDPH